MYHTLRCMYCMSPVQLFSAPPIKTGNFLMPGNTVTWCSQAFRHSFVTLNICRWLYILVKLTKMLARKWVICHAWQLHNTTLSSTMFNINVKYDDGFCFPVIMHDGVYIVFFFQAGLLEAESMATSPSKWWHMGSWSWSLEVVSETGAALGKFSISTKTASPAMSESL